MRLADRIGAVRQSRAKGDIRKNIRSVDRNRASWTKLYQFDQKVGQVDSQCRQLVVQPPGALPTHTRQRSPLHASGTRVGTRLYAFVFVHNMAVRNMRSKYASVMYQVWFFKHIIPLASDLFVIKMGTFFLRCLWAV